MIPQPNLPYELIGKAVVALAAIALAIILICIAILVLAFIWIRGWAFISNLMWRGYEPQDNRPPLWKMRISGVTIALSRFEFRKIPAAWREADELTDDDLTAHEAMIRYLKGTFIDE